MAGKFYHRIDWSSGGATHVFKLFLWTIAFGWIGNCNRRQLSFEFHSNRVLEIVYIHANMRDTRIYISLKKPAIWWNSEWIAARWGECHESEDGRYPDCNVYDGWLGYHLWV